MKNNNNNFEKAIIVIIIIIGVLLSSVQFFYNRSLCSDEVWLSLNIINKNHFELLKPLDYTQAAPILFLQIEKIFSELIPNSELGLRLFPLISFLLSLFLFYKILKTIHKNYYTIIFSLSLFVFNIYLIRYSNEVKQYMTDVLVLTLVYYLILRKYVNPKYKYYCLGIVGIISIFLSNVSPMILFTAGFYLLYDCYRNEKKYFPNLIGVSIGWVSSFLIYYFLFIYNNPVRDTMIIIWSYAFMPTNPLSLEFYKFLLHSGSMLLLFFFQYGNLGECLIILILIGIVSLIRKKRIDLIILTITPIVLQLLLSSFKLYPVYPRLLLYLCPVIIIICSFGFEYIVNKLFYYLKIERFRLLSISIPLLMLCYFYFLYYTDGYPFKRSELKNSITFIEQHMNKNDKVYVTYFASWPFQYYKEISYMKIDTNNIIIEDRYYMNDTISYSNKVSLLSGRVWFLFTLIGDEGKNMKFLVNYFNSKGKRAIQEFHTEASDVYLYDCSN